MLTHSLPEATAQSQHRLSSRWTSNYQNAHVKSAESSSSTWGRPSRACVKDSSIVLFSYPTTPAEVRLRGRREASARHPSPQGTPTNSADRSKTLDVPLFTRSQSPAYLRPSPEQGRRQPSSNPTCQVRLPEQGISIHLALSSADYHINPFSARPSPRAYLHNAPPPLPTSSVRARFFKSWMATYTTADQSSGGGVIPLLATCN